MSLDLDALLLRIWPESQQADREGLVSRGSVLAAGDKLRRLQTRIAPGERLELREPFGESPVLPSLAAGVRGGRVLVPGLPWRSGTLARRRGMTSAVRFERLDERDGVQLLEVTPAEGEAEASAFFEDVLRSLAESGRPVLGDVLRGGILIAGGLRLVAGDASLAWPGEPVFAGASGEAPVLHVSRATERIVGRGHPWILHDDESDDASRFAPGTRVQVEGPDGASLGVAHCDGPGQLTARMWAGPAQSGGSDSVEARVAEALGRRSALLEPGSRRARTDVFRLLHGEGDRLPGLFVDRLGPLLRVLVTSEGALGYRDRALDALVRGLEGSLGGDPGVIEVVHLRERPPGDLVCTRVLRGALPDAPGSTASEAGASTRLVVQEAGVQFLVDPGLSRPTRASPGFGLYPDQRDNRARLLAGVRKGGRLLNLFAHTGAFSVSWLAGQGATAVSVDLSGAYLRWLEENLARNGIDPIVHQSVRSDGRRYLETLDRSERFDAIVIDPPTAAAAGRRFWSVARDLPPLIASALAHLQPGGRLLVSRNDRKRAALRELVAEAAKLKGVRLAALESAPPGIDFPRRKGFPEGDPFTGVLATRA